MFGKLGTSRKSVVPLVPLSLQAPSHLTELTGAEIALILGDAVPIFFVAILLK